MNSLRTAAEKVASAIQEARTKDEGFGAVCAALGLSVDELNAIVEEEAPKLNGSGTPDAAMLHGLLIGATAASGDIEVDDWARYGKATMHPLRLAILEQIREAGVASPIELERVLGESLSSISYHVKELYTPASSGHPSFIKLVKTRPRRGALEHYYSLRKRPLYPKTAKARRKGSK